ncbi:MAG: TlyA family RNA methyltransferase [Acidobacteria bacterium]|nr:TlyA family RNA methyltransferase [Acidobacteriota bacterium]
MSSPDKTSKKERLDILVSQIEGINSREKAKALIMAGQVLIGTQRMDKPGIRVPIDSEIIIKGMDHPYVSRGGLKLEGALHDFNIDPTGKTGLDIGSSTGGFTDCLLQHGASKVYAVDVGSNLIDYKLRQDKRVILIEDKNARFLEFNDIGEKIDIAVTDVSFISLELIIPVLPPLMNENAVFLPLVKPQFEVGKNEVEKGGIIRDRKKHIAVIEKIISCGNQNGFSAAGLTMSRIKGQKGNTEYILHFIYTPGAPENLISQERIKEITGF